MREENIYRFDEGGKDPIRALLADAMERAVGARSERFLFDVAAPVLVAKARARDIPQAEAMLTEEVGDDLLEAFDLLGVDHDRAYEMFQAILRRVHVFLNV